MVDLHHQIVIKAPPAKVFAAVATESGMRGWWTRDTGMDPSSGGKAAFGFDRRSAVFHMTIEEITADGLIRMRCTAGQAEWAGTTLEWTVRSADGGSVLSFEHRDWKEMTDFCASCNSMWGNLMFRLKAYVETGKPAPQWTE